MELRGHCPLGPYGIIHRCKRAGVWTYARVKPCDPAGAVLRGTGLSGSSGQGVGIFSGARQAEIVQFRAPACPGRAVKDFESFGMSAKRELLISVCPVAPICRDRAAKDFVFSGVRQEVGFDHFSGALWFGL